MSVNLRDVPGEIKLKKSLITYDEFHIVFSWVTQRKVIVDHVLKYNKKEDYMFHYIEYHPPRNSDKEMLKKLSKSETRGK